MCDPVTMAVASFGMSAASAISGYEASDAQAKAQDQAYARNRTSALSAFTDSQGNLNQREEQVQDKASADRQENSLNARAAQATATTAAGEAGVGGISVASLVNDLGARAGRANDNITTNAQWDIANLQSAKKGEASQQVDRINSSQIGVHPGFADAGLRIASGALGAYNQYQQSQYYAKNGGINSMRY